ncbi:putative F-box protein PP2-B12 [Hibiscus syriacus]|uniref:putative F-box protein PP2-B12 n=1 Tax=Hibiscus syriacus TaxID=106335 RepID=UPI00192207C1|nr:putative F-box protein PP2-B12 [Hibiscus syriacus]
MDFTKILPEECQSLIISLTSPADACRSAMVSPSLRSVADSDAVWEKFFPCDYNSILSSSTSSLSLGKKDLYLSSHPVLIQNGTMSFQLEKGTRKRCYRLGARALTIIWGDSPDKWTWTSLPESRFLEVAELVQVWWIDVTGKIETRILSPNTNYAVYLVFKLRYQHILGFRRRPVGLNVSVDGVTLREERRVSLYPGDESRHVRDREDGWMEAEMGEFWNECGGDGIVEFSLKQIDTGYPKRGLIIEGIEIRSKNVGS